MSSLNTESTTSDFDVHTSKSVEDYLDEVSYSLDDGYIPTPFSLEFINFIKMVNGEDGEENTSPVLHFKMLDTLEKNNNRIAQLCFRGSGKTSLMAEYLILYIAIYSDLPILKNIRLGLYVSDSIENGVKNMRLNLNYRWENSEFLQEYIPHTRFTDVRWEFRNLEGKTTIFKGYGAKTGVRGTKEEATRPSIALLDDLVSDADARSATVIANIEDTVYKAVEYALHPKEKLTIWSGTPFNSRDPLYKAVESGAYTVNAFPVCETFPCSEEDFKPAWGDRFTYESIKRQYETAVKLNEIGTFNQEMLLRIMSDEDRLIPDSAIQWYNLDIITHYRDNFNYYITTDFAVSASQKADYSVISVWAYDNKGNWYWVDGILKKQTMDKNLEDLFRLAQEYSPQQVGVEVSGQQGGFIQWIQEQMIVRNTYFTLASENNNGKLGIRPKGDKLVRLNTMIPLILSGKLFFPIKKRNELILVEAMQEISLVSMGGIKSKHDDFLDTVSMLSVLTPWKPSQVTVLDKGEKNSIWEAEIEQESTALSSYIV